MTTPPPPTRKSVDVVSMALVEGTVRGEKGCAGPTVDGRSRAFRVDDTEGEDGPDQFCLFIMHHEWVKLHGAGLVASWEFDRM
jgi:hypothetical protein